MHTYPGCYTQCIQDVAIHVQNQSIHIQQPADFAAGDAQGGQVQTTSYGNQHSLFVF